ncbi:hypothetical protein V2J09_018402 [Rumex salicifolius]
MARTGMAAALIVALMAAVWTVATGQPSSNCMNVIISMSPCLDYIMGNSTTPTTGCCTQLASVVQSEPKCLCQVINGGGDVASLGISINRTIALQLPSACNVHTPSISRCNDVTSPSGSPSTPSTPSGTSPGSSTGSKSVPSVKTSKGHSMKAGLPLFLFAGHFLLAILYSLLY